VNLGFGHQLVEAEKLWAEKAGSLGSRPAYGEYLPSLPKPQWALIPARPPVLLR
jgi:hypothetical protein